MKYSILIVILLLTSIQGCKTIKSGLRSEGTGNIVLYTRGNEDRVNNVSDSDNMLRLINALKIQAEFFPNINGESISKNQTAHEMFDTISKAIEYLEEDDTLWWYMVGHGTEGIFTTSEGRIKYEELFDHMLNEVETKNKIIKRLNIFIMSCHSGSLIPIIQQYQGKLYKQLIVFTPVEADELAWTRRVFPELIASAEFLYLARERSIEDASTMLKQMDYNVGSTAQVFRNALKRDETCMSKIKFAYSSDETVINNGGNSSSSCDIDASDITLSNQKNPTWNDLINLTLWMFKRYDNLRSDPEYKQTPQFFTYPEEIKDEPIFK